jgi:hypothetical protein
LRPAALARSRSCAKLPPDGLAALAPGLRRPLRVVLEVAPRRLAALAGDLLLPLGVHRGEAARRAGPWFVVTSLAMLVVLLAR